VTKESCEKFKNKQAEKILVSLKGPERRAEKTLSAVASQKNLMYSNLN